MHNFTLPEPHQLPPHLLENTSGSKAAFNQMIAEWNADTIAEIKRITNANRVRDNQSAIDGQCKVFIAELKTLNERLNERVSAKDNKRYARIDAKLTELLPYSGLVSEYLEGDGYGHWKAVCCSCGRQYDYEGDPLDFSYNDSYCFGSQWCVP